MFDKERKKFKFGTGKREELPLFVDAVFVDSKRFTAGLNGFAVNAAKKTLYPCNEFSGLIGLGEIIPRQCLMRKKRLSRSGNMPQKMVSKGR